MDLTSNLVVEATRYCEVRGISLARLSTIVINDGKFFRRIGGGGDFTVRTYERFMTYFEEHPAEAPSRPAPTEAA